MCPGGRSSLSDPTAHVQAGAEQKAIENLAYKVEMSSASRRGRVRGTLAPSSHGNVPFLLGRKTACWGDRCERTHAGGEKVRDGSGGWGCGSLYV